jgi:hypothetical protein
MSPAKLPRTIKKDYIIPEGIRDKFVKNHLLLSPIGEFGNIKSIINSIPAKKMTKLQAEIVYNDVKDSIYNMMNYDDPTDCLPLTVRNYFRQVYSYISAKKTKTNFIKTYNSEIIENNKLIASEKVIESRKRTYEEAQLLGSELTRHSVYEFRDHYIGGEPSHSDLNNTTAISHPPHKNDTINITDNYDATDDTDDTDTTDFTNADNAIDTTDTTVNDNDTSRNENNDNSGRKLIPIILSKNKVITMIIYNSFIINTYFSFEIEETYI